MSDEEGALCTMGHQVASVQISTRLSYFMGKRNKYKIHKIPGTLTKPKDDKLTNL